MAPRWSDRRLRSRRQAWASVESVSRRQGHKNQPVAQKMLPMLAQSQSCPSPQKSKSLLSFSEAARLSPPQAEKKTAGKAGTVRKMKPRHSEVHAYKGPHQQLTSNRNITYVPRLYGLYRGHSKRGVIRNQSM